MNAPPPTKVIIPFNTKLRMSASDFSRLAAQRYPINNRDDYHHIMNQRGDYIAALHQCKSQPAYYLQTPWGIFPASSEPLMPEDTKGWTTVRGSRKTKKRRSSDRVEVDNYDDY